MDEVLSFYTWPGAKTQKPPTCFQCLEMMHDQTTVKKYEGLGDEGHPRVHGGLGYFLGLKDKHLSETFGLLPYSSPLIIKFFLSERTSTPVSYLLIHCPVISFLSQPRVSV